MIRPGIIAVARFRPTRTSGCRHKGTVVFTAVLIPFNSMDPDGKFRYHVFKDRVIPAIQDQGP